MNPLSVSYCLQLSIPIYCSLQKPLMRISLYGLCSFTLEWHPFSWKAEFSQKTKIMHSFSRFYLNPVEQTLNKGKHLHSNFRHLVTRCWCQHILIWFSVFAICLLWNCFSVCTQNTWKNYENQWEDISVTQLVLVEICEFYILMLKQFQNKRIKKTYNQI